MDVRLDLGGFGPPGNGFDWVFTGERFFDQRTVFGRSVRSGRFFDRPGTGFDCFPTGEGFWANELFLDVWLGALRFGRFPDRTFKIH